MAGRKTGGSEHAKKYGGSEEAKKRLELVLKTLSGEMSIPRACEMLGIGEAMFHRLRDRAVVAMGGALERRKTGRKKAPEKVPDEEKESLRRENLRLKMQIRGAQIREKMAILMPEVLKRAEDAQKKTGQPELDLYPEGRFRVGRKGTGKKSRKR